jgi:hypothetical protein
MLRSSLYTNSFVGNVYVSGNVTAVTIIADTIYGNLTSNAWFPGNLNELAVTGNMTANYFIGNGALLTGLMSSLPAIANIDVHGNVIGAYANVTNVIAASGNVGNVHFAGGNVAASGQINALGNVVAGYFVGNGSQLSGIALPATANIDVRGNVIGTYANVTQVIANTLVLNSNNIAIGAFTALTGQGADSVAI